MKSSFRASLGQLLCGAIVLVVGVWNPIASFAQSGQNSPVFVEPVAPKPRMWPSKGSIEFERLRLDFAPQSVGITNCVNIPINNTTDRPRQLTALISHDPTHFSISSPAEVMLPMTIGANSSLYIAVCFKGDKVKEYKSDLLAAFQSDTVRLGLSGKVIEKKDAPAVPTNTELTIQKKKKNQWKITIGLPRHATILLHLENALGKTIRNFPFSDVKAPGYYEVDFDGKDDNEKPLEAGGYVLRLEMSDLESHAKSHTSSRIEVK